MRDDERQAIFNHVTQEHEPQFYSIEESEKSHINPRSTYFYDMNPTKQNWANSNENTENTTEYWSTNSYKPFDNYTHAPVSSTKVSFHPNLTKRKETRLPLNYIQQPETKILTTCNQRNTYNSVYKENSRLENMRALSRKDALDLIPNYSGSNSDLGRFINGCLLARSIVPVHHKEEFAGMVKMKLSGIAAEAVEGKHLHSIDEIISLFETWFGEEKTLYALHGELAVAKQGDKEKVLAYANRLERIGRNIRKAAIRENKMESTYTLENDLLQHFLKGLKWEIIARTGPHTSLQRTINEAIEKEREISSSDRTANTLIKRVNFQSCQIYNDK